MFSNTNKPLPSLSRNMERISDQDNVLLSHPVPFLIHHAIDILSVAIQSLGICRPFRLIPRAQWSKC